MPMPSTLGHAASPDGSAPARIAIAHPTVSPTGVPKARPIAIAQVSSEPIASRADSAPSNMPAFAQTHRGTMANAIQGWRSCSKRSSGATVSRLTVLSVCNASVLCSRPCTSDGDAWAAGAPWSTRAIAGTSGASANLRPTVAPRGTPSRCAPPPTPIAVPYVSSRRCSDAGACRAGRTAPSAMPAPQLGGTERCA